MKVYYQIAIELVSYYQMKYNTQFEISELYSLYPEDNEYGFTESWPFLDSGGVYLILNKDKEVIYVGKTDKFGHRLYDHFREGADGKCIIQEQGWKNQPFYIINIKVPDDRLYENLSLEGYLISVLDPDDNIRGWKKQ